MRDYYYYQDYSSYQIHERCIFMTANPQTCQKCGSPVTPGMKFCESCGAKIEALPACPKCGAPLVPEVKFCESCGAPVSPPAAQVPETLPVREVKPPVESPVKAEEKIIPAPEKPAPAPAPVQEKPAETVPVAVPAPPAPAEKTMTPASPVNRDVKIPPAPALAKEPAKSEKVKEVPKETGPKKPMSQMTLIIAGVIILALLGAAVYFVGLPMLSGSSSTPSQNQQQPQVTTSAGSSSGNPSTTAAASQAGIVSLTPGPTDVLPANRALSIDVERNAISHDITVTFQGGDGQNGVKELLVTLSRSDGTVETQSFKPTYRGTSITLKGTEKSDRVEVTANFYSGETYKIVDKVFEYKKRIGSSG